ncbi:methyl-accepting chemotaxis protein [Oryzifoliimicrobium ureilyticus]|uniref:methyl-accepting chemotaxis protein n=1 Tax=Oryzifoliimicrobium ureilyticus TaxID=3113724 RepID=UPI0030761BC4
MKNISIIGKFLIIMAVFGLFSLGAASYAVFNIGYIDTKYSKLLDGESVAATYLARANRSLQAGRASIGELLMARTDEDNDRAMKELEGNRKSFADFTEKAKAALPDDAIIPALQAEGLQILNETCAATVKAAQASKTDTEISVSQQQFLKECQPSFVQIIPKMTQAVTDISNASDKASDELSALAAQTMQITIAALIAGLVIVMAAGFFAMRSWVVRPIRDLAATMKVLAAGDLTATVHNAERRDEVGAMAAAVQIFKDNGLAALEAARQSETERSANEAARARSAEQDRQRAESMAQATEGLAGGLKSLAAGDLTVRLEQPFAQDFETLRTDFNATVVQLADTMRSVSVAGSSIDNGAREISQGAQDLSKRTEQQAASLEETAAALDEITANVANASKRTEEARQVAVEANQSARRSAEVVSSAVDAMHRIETSSSQISNIIGVIDEIAFQTNLLALNAGVEAARAGEAGKGFAVVAQEVRELAQRSAQAAKEIKDLIRNSVQEVSTGVKLVQDTGEVLKVIEQQVVTINTQLDAIATSAKEQSVGLAEVNTAVNQMDQVTQQNAAMVEQSTAASASLSNEVIRLREIIHQFKLEAGGSASAHARAPTGSSQNAAPQAASGKHAPAPSPARRMLAKVANAVGMRGSSEGWDEF